MLPGRRECRSRSAAARPACACSVCWCCASAASEAARRVRTDGQFVRGEAAALLGLGDVGGGLGVLRGKLAQAFLVELNAAFVAIHLALQFQPALLRGGDLVFQFGQPLAQLRDFILGAQHVGGFGFDFVAQIVGGGLPFARSSPSNTSS